MAPVSSQRLVPIRPSPLKGVSSSQTLTVITPVSVSASTVKTGAKRKLADEMTNQVVKCKKQNTGVTGSKSSSQSGSMGRRNARERNRVKQVNNSFTTLRQHIPGAAKAKKISKVETLKQAVDYIRGLQQLLDDHDAMIARTENGQANITSPTSIQNQVSSNNVTVSPYKGTVEQFSPPTVSQRQQMHENITTEPVLSNTAPNAVYSNYYYSDTISPVSPTIYPLHVQNNSKAAVSSQGMIFKTEIDVIHSEFNQTSISSSMTPTYSSTPTPLTPVTQTSFTLTPLQSSPYSASQLVYPTTVTYSPNSIAEPSPTSIYSPNSLPLSPSASPNNIAIPEYSPSYPKMYEEAKPSLIEAQNFIIPANELPYCLASEMTTIDIDKATATTKDDLELLDAIAMWQDC